ncbi:MAG: reverse transcriptase family protein [bacterium]|nr:reverse transcriptase family protein [bacterium]
MRRWQSNLYTKLLLPKLDPSPYSHGGVKGRDIKTNAMSHQNSRFLMKTDISNFYPSIHRRRVYDLFTSRFKCSPDVARYCTQLCTYQHKLALGLVTSPILADQAIHRVDLRLGAACKSAGLIYTRFVDDIVISGAYDLSKSGFETIARKVLENDGFRMNEEKTESVAVGKNSSITGIRILNAKRIDVRSEYAAELERQLMDLRNLANDDLFDGPFFTQQQVWGRIQFVRWVNPKRYPNLAAKFRTISWRNAYKFANQRGLVAAKKRLKQK